ncbi:MAG TPA: SIR2 family protein [Vicinamibacterales bacterium]|nr:SIR2 family protein [Vicinamibacterales bacterium]
MSTLPPAAARLGEIDSEPPYELIRDGLASGKVIPFLGSGVSLGSRSREQHWTSPTANFLPNAAELAEYLDRRSGYPSGAPSDLTRVAQYFDGVAGRGGLDDELHAVFSKAYTPTPIHYHLAEQPNLLIVTTNYDDLQEQAFREKKRPFHVVTYRTGIPTFLFKEHDSAQSREVHANEMSLPVGDIPIVYKMHGACDPANNEHDSYVITEDDYVDFLSRMTSQTAIPAVFAEPFRRSHFLFLGYGLRDWNLRVVLHKIWQNWPRRRYASWAIQHRAERLEREFWSRRLLTIYELTLDHFLERLQQPAAT